jgi:hypothetical protein
MKNWKTTLFGVLGAVANIAPVLHSAGITVGHWGGSDFLQVGAGISALLLGYYAKDKDVTGTSK